MINASFASIERSGPWQVPEHLEVRVSFGNAELDLREAELGDATTIDVRVKFGNCEIFVPHGLAVNLDVRSKMAHVAEVRDGATPTGGKRVHITGKVSFGNCEVIALAPGESKEQAMHRVYRARRHARWHELHEE